MRALKSDGLCWNTAVAMVLCGNMSVERVLSGLLEGFLFFRGVHRGAGQ